MDVLSHALWAGAAAQWMKARGVAIDGRMTAVIVALAVAPDVVQLAPAVAWSLGEAAPLDFLHDHLSARPGTEPPMALWAEELSHHLHCIFHSVFVAAAATAALWRWRPRWLPALAGWWLHIALDIPTHSSDYYAVPLFYPFTDWGVDGVAWTTPWVLALNFLGLAAAYLALWRHRHRTAAAGSP